MNSLKETSKGFTNENFFLSNFSVSPIAIKYLGHDFVMATGEHVFQGMKVADSFLSDKEKCEWLKQLSHNNDPLYSKRMGRGIKIDVQKWNAHATVMMQRTQELKYSQNSDLKRKLIETDDLILVEYNTWGDTIWGVDNRKGGGENRLGQILMNLRTRFIKE